MRAVNKVIQPMGSLQPAIPLPSIVMDFQDSFFIIPLQEQGGEKLTFISPTYNNVLPVKRY